MRSNRLDFCNRLSRQLAVALLIGLPLSAFGCGNKTLFPVRGKVTHKDGSPVSGGMVIFEPLSQKISARGEIHSDGSYQVGTYANNDGAMEGEYKVLIAPPPLPEEGKRPRSPIPQKYQSLESTPLKFTVRRDASYNQFDIKLD